MTFPFETLYDFFAKPMAGKILKSPVSDPILMQLQVRNGRPVVGAMAPTMMVLLYLVDPDGQKKLLELINTTIASADDSFCMILAHEGHIKLFQGSTTEELTPMLDKGLSNDPTAQHVLMVRIFHRTGVYSGFLPIDENRRVQYKAGTGLSTEVLHIKVDADQNIH